MCTKIVLIAQVVFSLSARTHTQTHKSPVLEDLSGPNRAWLLGVYVVTAHPLLSVYGIIYVIGYTSHLYQNLPD